MTDSTAITNADAVPPVMTNRILVGGPTLVACGTVEVAAADDDGSIYRFVRLPSNARIVSIKLSNDAITDGTAYEVGLYAKAGGAEADADLFASTLDLSTAGAAVEVRFEASDIATIEQRLWELLGFAKDTHTEYDLALTGTTVGTAAGTLSVEVAYTV